MRQQENDPVTSDTEAATSSDASASATLLVDDMAAAAHSRCSRPSLRAGLGVVAATVLLAVGAVLTLRHQSGGNKERTKPADVLNMGAFLQAAEETRECRPSCDAQATPSTAASSTTGKWALRQKKTGCHNWQESKLGNTTIESSPDACGRRCKDQAQEGCVGFNYQPEECPITAEAEQKGACSLWRQYCQSEVNECWDDYMMLTEEVPKWTMRAYKTGCENWEEILLEEYHAVPTPDVCGDKCWDTPGCTGFGYQADECKNALKGANAEESEDIMEGNRPMTCYLWKDTCKSEKNSCWDDYVLWSPPEAASTTAGEAVEEEEQASTTAGTTLQPLESDQPEPPGGASLSSQGPITNFISAGESAANAEPSLDNIDVSIVEGDQAET